MPLSSSNFDYTPGIYAEGYIVFVFPFVHSYVCSFDTLTKIIKFCVNGYINNYSSEIIHAWAMHTLEGLLTFHEFWPQGPCPGAYPFLRH